MHIAINQLATSSARDNFIDVNNVLDGLQSAILENDNYIIKNYPGQYRESLELHTTLVKIFDEQYALLNSVSLALQQQQALLDRISEKLSPLYARADTLSTHMLTVIDASTRRLLSHSHDTLQWTTLFAVGIGILMIVLAIVFQRTAAARLREREYRDYVLRIVSESAGTMFFIYNLHERAVEFASPNSQHLLGIASHELEADPLKLFTYAERDQLSEIRPFFLNEILQVPVERECQFLNPHTGASVWTLLSISPIREASIVSRYIVSLSDITEIRKAQGALRDALLNAQNANRAKSDFLSRMSHEIRTPLNVIIGMTTIAASALRDPNKIEDCLAKISMASRHLLMLINDVLDMAKIESGKFTITRESFNFGELVQNLSTLIHQQALQKNLRFDILMTGVEHEHLVGDALRVNQILLNILSNALKFTPANGVVRLHIKELPVRPPARARMRFTITDTGVGMSQDFMDRLFNPFEQEHTPSQNSAVGTGLGMAITGNLVSLMGGSIRVTSVPGEGSTFTVDIDFDIDGSEATAPYLPELTALKVLVVDSDQQACEHMAAVLARIGVHADRVLSSSAARQRLCEAKDAAQNYDVVFVDWKPDDHTVDTLGTVRGLRTVIGPDPMIIGISNTDWTPQEDNARRAGFSAFMLKPLFQSSLYNALLRVTRPCGSQQDNNDAPQLEGRRILLVEDNELNMEIAVEILRPSGVQLVCAENGREAVDTFTAAPVGSFDMVLMDIQMPIMDGYQATRAIRALSREDARLVPIIAMTANAFAEDVAAAHAAGMNAHISKPIDTALLLKTISEELTKSTPVGQADAGASSSGTRSHEQAS